MSTLRFCISKSNSVQSCLTKNKCCRFVSRSTNPSLYKSGCRRYKSSTSPSTTTAATSTVKNAGSRTKSVENNAVPLGLTVGAMLGGIVTVAGIATGVEYATAQDVPDFDPTKNRFDPTTFYGRFCHMFLACDPRLLLYSEEEAKQCRQRILEYSTTMKPDNTSSVEWHRSLWEAHRISSAILHPDTGEASCPAPFRMSGYVPFNGPICVAMVTSTSTPALLFWSWVNQSQNALVNYFNRSSSEPMSNETLVGSYSAAVASALTVAFGLATVVQKKFDAHKAKTLMRYVAFPSAVVASSLNCYIVRSPEIKTGVPLMNADGDLLGFSQVAAERGVNSTTASRAILQAPVYFMPPLLLSSIFKSYLLKHPAMTVPLTTYLVLVSFGVGLPATVAIFPQLSSIDIADVEEQFQGLTDKEGRPYHTLYYNKGL